MTPLPCDNGCDAPAKGRGLCNLCYLRARRDGTLPPKKPRRLRPEAERFWEKVDKSGGPDACWLWTGPINMVSGYGIFALSAPDGRNVGAHRYVMEKLGGPIPSSIDACHKCDVRACVNPTHLFLGTRRDNMRDMLAKGRGPYQQRTTCANGHPRTAEHGTLDSTKNGGRRWRCRTCRRAKYAAREAS